MNGFEYTQRQVTLPEPDPEVRKAPPCPTCVWWHKGNCSLVWGSMQQDFSCYGKEKK